MPALRRFGRVLALLLAGLLPPLAAHAAIFDDGNDRKILFDLRLKPESRLTDEERMILRAADSYGNVGFCGKAGGNATLIDYFGRPAIVTSAHMFFDKKTGKPKCSDAELRNATYMPNVSYIDERGSHPESFTHRRIKLVLPGVNERVERATRASLASDPAHYRDDLIIFYLEEDISKDIMPDGHRRGSLALASIDEGDFAFDKESGRLVMIGVAPDVGNGRPVLHQTCLFNISRASLLIFHTCDTIVGSSGSALLLPVDGELQMLGVHNAGTEEITKIETLGAGGDRGIGTIVEMPGEIPNFTAAYRLIGEPFRNPVFIPYQLQFLLHRAGDYTSKLDNQWGPGSRKALDAFVSRTGACLPGREPGMELWDALEAAMEDPGAGCTPEPGAADVPDTPPDGVADLGAMLDAICIAGRLEPQTIGSLVEAWTRDNAFEFVKHYPPKEADPSREESWDMKKDDRAFAAAFIELADEDGPKKACRVMGYDLDAAGVRDHVAARYGFGQAATDDEDETLVASWTAALDGYADAMTIRIRKIGPVVDVWFRE